MVVQGYIIAVEIRPFIFPYSVKTVAEVSSSSQIFPRSMFGCNGDVLLMRSILIAIISPTLNFSF